MRFPSIIDRYIIRQFIGTFVFAISLLAIIVIIFDLSEKIDDFLTKGAPFHAIVFDYYFNFLPYFINLFSHLFVFIAVIFFTSRMASRTEIIAILNGGVSFWRFLVPYIFTALLLGLFSLVLANFVIPHSNRKMREFEKLYYRNPFQNRDINIHMQISPGTFVYVESFNVSNQTGNKFALEKFENDLEVYKLAASQIVWVDTLKQWKLMNYHERTFNGIHETFRSGTQLDTTFSFTAAEFQIDKEDKKIMDYWDLNHFIEKEKLKGATNITAYEVEKYRRMLFPIATVILTLIGVSLSSRKVRGGIGMHLGMGIALAFGFIMLMQLSEMFSRFGSLSPFMGVLIPNLIYAAVAVFLLKKAQK